MKLDRASESIRQVAKEAGVSEEKVIAEIEAAIADAIETVQKEGDKKKLAMWNAIPCVGDKPTAVEFVAFLGGFVNEVMEYTGE